MDQAVLKSTDGKLTFALSGSIDASQSDEFFETVEDEYEKDRKDILFECKDLAFVDSTVIGVFVKICKMAKADGHSLTFCDLQPRIEKMLKVCNLGDMMGL